MVLRGFWKRWTFLSCFCLLAIAFFFYSTRFKSAGNFQTSELYWLYSENSTHLKTCRNSKQGPNLIADEKGYVCSIEEVMKSGCCNPKRNSTRQFFCLTCQTNHCCKLFEHCISCCLQPKKRKLLELVVRHAETVHDPLILAVKDSFDLCLNKCRTSSASVRQENIYRDSVYKYCFGIEAPHIVLPNSHRDNG